MNDEGYYNEMIEIISKLKDTKWRASKTSTFQNKS